MKVLLKMLKKVTKSKKDNDDDEDGEATRGRSKVKQAEKITFPKFPQPEHYRFGGFVPAKLLLLPQIVLTKP